MNILILGGSKFVGKNFVDYMSLNSDYNLILANRGITKTPDIVINRDNKKDCSNLKNKEYDFVVDFSCYDLNQFKNTYQSLKFNRYIFISTSAVEGIPFQNVSPDMYEMARYAYNKKECEDFILSNIKSYSIIRPCYIVGKDDYTNRFYKKDNKYYWNNGLELTYYIEADALSKVIFDEIGNTSNSIVNPCK
jgi:nucleoside-diphosphate-sugar epimerase